MSDEVKTSTCEEREHEHWEWHRRDKHDYHKHRTRAEVALGPIWFIGWLFTIGYCQLPFFWKGVLGLIVWPYYLGQYLGIR